MKLHIELIAKSYIWKDILSKDLESDFLKKVLWKSTEELPSVQQAYPN